MAKTRDEQAEISRRYRERLREQGYHQVIVALPRSVVEHLDQVARGLGCPRDALIREILSREVPTAAA
jgi:hypothetical protein